MSDLRDLDGCEDLRDVGRSITIETLVDTIIRLTIQNQKRLQLQPCSRKPPHGFGRCIFKAGDHSVGGIYILHADANGRGWRTRR